MISKAGADEVRTITVFYLILYECATLLFIAVKEGAVRLASQPIVNRKNKPLAKHPLKLLATEYFSQLRNLVMFHSGIFRVFFFLFFFNVSREYCILYL